MQHISEIRVRDPYIVCTNGKYYLISSQGKSVVARASDDLEHFSDPMTVFTPPENFWATRDYWAPEVHQYRGKWYLFLSLKSDAACRGTQIFVSDTFCPEEGMNFTPITERPITPADWESLDGTLYEEDGVPYIVFCHEWVQIGDGEICAMPLTADLTAPAGEPKLLFHASDAPWVQPPFISPRNDLTTNRVTDGPFFYKMQSGALAMLWSSGGHADPADPIRYSLGVAISPSGKLHGSWTQEHPLLFTQDGGHGMIFTDLEGKLRVVLHAPNGGELERMRVFYLHEENGALSLR